MKFRDSRLLLCTLLLTALTCPVWSYTGFKRPAESKCRTFSPVPINETWFLEKGEIGLTYRYGTKLHSTSGLAAPHFQMQDDDNFSHRKCWTVITKVLDYTFPLEAVMWYNQLNQAKGELNTDGSPFSAVLKFYGDFAIVLTDNSSFALFYGCVHEMKEFWTVVVPFEVVELSYEAKKMIFTYVDNTLKFSRKDKDMANESDPIRFVSTSTADCEPAEAGGPLDMLVPKGLTRMLKSRT